MITVSCTCAPSALRLSDICLPSLGDVARFNALHQSHQCDATSTHLPRACRVHRRPRTNPPPGHDATVAPLRACAAPRRTASLSYCPAGRCQASIPAAIGPSPPLQLPLRFSLCGYSIGVDSVRSRTLQLLVGQHLCLSVPQASIGPSSPPLFSLLKARARHRRPAGAVDGKRETGNWFVRTWREGRSDR